MPRDERPALSFSDFHVEIRHRIKAAEIALANIETVPGRPKDDVLGFLISQLSAYWMRSGGQALTGEKVSVEFNAFLVLCRQHYPTLAPSDHAFKETARKVLSGNWMPKKAAEKSSDS